MKFILVIISILFISSCGIYGNEKDIAGRKGIDFLCVPSNGGPDINYWLQNHNRIYKDTPAESYLYMTIYAPDTAKIHLYYNARRHSEGPGSKTKYLFAHTTFKDAILKMKKTGAVSTNKEWYKFGQWYFHRNGRWLVDTRSFVEGGLPVYGVRLECQQIIREVLEKNVKVLKQNQKISDEYLKELIELQESQYQM